MEKAAAAFAVSWAAMLAELMVSWAAMLVELVAADKANKQHRHKTDTCKKTLANNAKVQPSQDLDKRAEALAELVSAAEQGRQESEDPTAVLAKMTLANEHCCQEAAEHGEMLGETALAKE
jgi:hypothetical protein